MFEHLHMAPELACEFLAVFSRMEHALKSTNYAIDGGGKVEPAWDIFANSINEVFLNVEDPELLTATNYLLEFPPKKQILHGKKVKFIDQKIDPKQRKTQQLIKIIRSVRNNLFHGGKYLPDGEIEPGRNEKLVRCSIKVLNQCKLLDNNVKNSYER